MAMSEVLVVNQMTWPELARQCIVANVRSLWCMCCPFVGVEASAVVRTTRLIQRPAGHTRGCL